jgi:hypothetical protein
MNQEILLWSVTVAAGLFTAGLVWIAPDLLAFYRTISAARAAKRKLKADADALLQQAEDRAK